MVLIASFKMQNTHVKRHNAEHNSKNWKHEKIKGQIRKLQKPICDSVFCVKMFYVLCLTLVTEMFWPLKVMANSLATRANYFIIKVACISKSTAYKKLKDNKHFFLFHLTL